MSKFNYSTWFRVACVAFVVVVLIGFYTVSDYGMSWDEPFRFKGGDAKLLYYEELFRGEQPARMTDSYPGLFDLPLAWFHQAFPELGTRSEKGHMWSLLFGLVGILSAWRLTALIGGERAGFWAMVFLITMPRYYGHMFFNPKDVPFAAMYVLALWGLACALQQLPAFASWRSVILVGLTAGLAISTRIAGLLLLFYFAMTVFGFILSEHVQYFLNHKSLKIDKLIKDLVQWAMRGALAGVIAYIVLMLFWPAGHGNPLSILDGAIGNAQSYGWDGLILMDGMFWRAQDLPVYYMVYWLLHAVPEHILLLLLLACGAALLSCWQWVKDRRMPPGNLFWPSFLVVFSLGFPLIYMLIKQPVLYDGLRHFLFLLPMFGCIAALSLEWLIRKLDGLEIKRLPAFVQVAVACCVCFVVIDLLVLHPYQYVYFNQASGGLQAAYDRDETDYWGISHKEAAEWLNQYVEQIDAQDERVFRVFQKYTPWMLDAHLSDRLLFTYDRNRADFAIAITRLNFHHSTGEGAEVIHVVERQGVPLCFVFKLPES